MFEVKVEGGRVQTDPDDKCWVLPSSVTPELMTAVFQCDIGEDGHIANLFDHLTQADRDRFADACEASPAHQAAFSNAFVHWAIVGGRDGKWDINQFTIGYRRPIGSWLADEVLVDSISRVWYAVNRRGIWSDLEFDFRYGQTLQTHIRHYAEERLIVVESVVQAIDQPLETKRVTLLSPEGTIAVMRLTGPPSVDVKLWELPPGYKWMADEPIEA